MADRTPKELGEEAKRLLVEYGSEVHTRAIAGGPSTPCALAFAAVESVIDTLVQRLEATKQALEKANAQAEHFEREWYLRGDRLDSAEQKLAEAQDNPPKTATQRSDVPIAWMYETTKSCTGPFTEREVALTIDRWERVPSGYVETPLSQQHQQKLAEVEADAARWRFFEHAGHDVTLRMHCVAPSNRRDAIDRAMQEGASK